MSGGRAVAVRDRVDRWFLALVLVGVAVAVVGGLLTADAYLGTDTRSETRQGASWESVGTFDHHAEVRESAGPFEAGTVLTNRSTYFLEPTPVLDGRFDYTYEASDGGSLDVETRVVLVTRSVVDDGGEESVLWRDEEELAAERVDSLSPGESVSVPFSWNVSAARAAATATEEQLGTTAGDTEMFLEARVTVAGTRNGRAVDVERTYPLDVTFDDGVYRVDDPGQVTHQDTRTQTVSVTVPPGTLERVGGPVTLAVGVFATLGLLVGRHRGVLTVDEAEREWLAYRSTRREFDDWITTVRSGADAVRDETVRVESLQGLVDLAIDTDARVVEAADTGRCVVRHDGLSYVYDPPPAPGAERPAPGTADTPDTPAIADGPPPETPDEGDGDDEPGPAVTPSDVVPGPDISARDRDSRPDDGE